MPYTYLGAEGNFIRLALVEFDFSEVCAALLISAALVIILKSFGFRGAPVFVSFIIIVFTSSLVGVFQRINDTFSTLGSYADISDYLNSAMKVVGVGYLSGISCDMLREAGEAGIAKCVGIAAKFELILIAIPYIEEMIHAVLLLSS